jgi:hypothetical protein
MERSMNGDLSQSKSGKIAGIIWVFHVRRARALSNPFTECVGVLSGVDIRLSQKDQLFQLYLTPSLSATLRPDGLRVAGHPFAVAKGVSRSSVRSVGRP